MMSANFFNWALGLPFKQYAEPAYFWDILTFISRSHAFSTYSSPPSPPPDLPAFICRFKFCCRQGKTVIIFRSHFSRCFSFAHYNPTSRFCFILVHPSSLPYLVSISRIFHFLSSYDFFFFFLWTWGTVFQNFWFPVLIYVVQLNKFLSIDCNCKKKKNEILASNFQLKLFLWFFSVTTRPPWENQKWIKIK